MTFLILFHIANAVALFAFLFRDQFHLRVAVIVSMVMQAAYYFFVPGGPQYDPLFWKVMTVLLNAAMIALLFRDRLSYGIDAEVKPLLAAIRVLTPGRFRRLIRGAGRVEGPRAILIQGEKPASLYYLLSGSGAVVKDGRSVTVEPGTFLGEIAFLTGSEATASASLHPGARALAWPADELRQLLIRDRSIDIALRGLLNHDLAAKTARSRLPRADQATIA